MAQVKKFKVGEKAVYPAHGVGEIVDLQVRSIGGKEQQFYILNVLENGMKIMVPVETAQTTGLRHVMSRDKAREVMDILKADEVAVTSQPWNRRNREYTDMLKSGDPFEVARVFRDIYRLKSEKELSFGERRLLDLAHSLLVLELSLALNKTEADIDKDIDSIFQSKQTPAA
ncbi:MAG: CarD family transcriptional regulator [Proteobacteria bacterium]|jgi:CarD family transcriptional regulator|nr:CarD family transcriptional regulator [Pseudomonadota bacterium]NLN62216.1 CarD family transcriptional regulator [Myxococcales bacterium]